jgi:hypothetical protein
MERSGESRWRLTDPVRTRADRWSADAVAGALAHLERDRSLTNDRGDEGLAEMGLAPPRARVAFTLAPGEGAAAEPTILELGSEVPATSATFARIAGQEEILLLPSSSIAALLKPIGDYRDRALLDATILDIGEARISGPSIGSLRFRRREEEWWVEEPYEDLAAGEVVQSIVSGIIGLRAERFLDGAPGPPDASPRAIVRLFDRAGVELASVTLGRNDPDSAERARVRVEFPSEPGILAEVPTAGLDGLEKPAEEFRSRKALPFRTWEAKGLRLSSPTVTLAFAKKDDLWSAESPASLPLDAAEVEDALDEISGLVIASYAIPAGATAASLGLEPERTSIEVRTEESGTPRTRTLVLGLPSAGKDQVYARAVGRPTIFTVPASVLERIHGGAALYTLEEDEAGAGSTDGTIEETDETGG